MPLSKFWPESQKVDSKPLNDLKDSKGKRKISLQRNLNTWEVAQNNGWMAAPLFLVMSKFDFCEEVCRVILWS